MLLIQLRNCQYCQYNRINTINNSIRLLSNRNKERRKYQQQKYENKNK